MKTSACIYAILLLSTFLLISGSPCTLKDQANCAKNSVCDLGTTGPYCKCLKGFLDFNGVCIDKDECLFESMCELPSKCQNTPGSYFCQCPPGYFMHGIFCSDMNECNQSPFSVCDSRAEVGVCINSIGSYSCSCSANYRLAPDQRTCIDINECTGNTHGCTDICTNTPGTFKCSCRKGFTLQSDGTNCLPSVACSDGLECPSDCANIDGVDTCVCKNGFRFDDASNKCIEIDECLTRSPCDERRGLCINSPGSYLCICKEGYTLGPSNECNDRNGGWSQWTDWLPCNQSCNAGVSVRYRFCDNPPKAGVGSACDGEDSERVVCNTNACPLTEEEKKYGYEFLLNGLEHSQLLKVEPVLLGSLAKAINSYCLENNANLRECCQTPTNFAPNISMSPLIKWNDIVTGNGFPRAIKKTLLKMLVIFKFPKTSAYCETVGSRKKRQTTTNNANINPSVFNNAITQQQLYLAQMALSQSILAAYNQTTSITIYKEDEDKGLPWWAILLIVLACILLLILLILLIWFICKKCCNKKNRVDSSRNDRNDNMAMRDTEKRRREDERRREKEEKRKEKERRKIEKEEEKDRRDNMRRDQLNEEERRRRAEEEERRRKRDENLRYNDRDRETDSARSRDMTSAGRNRGEGKIAEQATPYRPPVLTDFDEDLDNSTPRPTNRFNIPPKVNPINLKNTRTD